MKKSLEWHLCKSITFFVILISTIGVLSVWKTSNLDGNPDGVSSFTLDTNREILSFSLEKSSYDDPSNVSCDEIPKLDTKHLRCEKAKSCSPDGLLNYREFYYCTCQDYSWAAMIVFAFSLILLFYLLGTTAESYFCPPLAYLSELLGLSPDVAGVTLLAFGNGAPDVFSTLAGIQGGNFGIAIGELLGAALFASTTIVGTVGLLATCELQPFPFIRDVVFFLVAVVFVLGISFDGRIYLWECFVFVAYYSFYVIFTVLAQKYRDKKAQIERDKLLHTLPHQSVIQDLDGYPSETGFVYEHDEPEEGKSLLAPTDEHTHGSFDHGKDSSGRFFAKVGLYAPVEEDAHKRGSISKRSSVSSFGSVGSHGSQRYHVHPIQHAHQEQDPIQIMEERGAIKSIHSMQEAEEMGFFYPFLSVWSFFLAKAKWHKKLRYQKIFYIFGLPFKTILDLTVPSPKDKFYNRVIFSLFPLTSPLVLILATETWGVYIGPVPLWGVVEMAGFCATVLVWFTSDFENPPRYKIVFVFISFVLAITWIFLIADEIVSLLEMVGDIFSISQTILGITVLAWGNSVSDFAADFVVAKKGFQGMAVAACFAGPCLNILIGLGLSLTTQCITQYPTPFDTGKVSLKLLLGFGFLIFGLLSSLVVVPLQKFIVSRPYAIYLIVFYVTFNVVSLAVEFAGVDITL